MNDGHSDGAPSRTQLPPMKPLATEVYVTPDGDDAGDGSPSRPLASLNRARDVVRQWRSQGATGPIAVTLAPG